MLNKTKTRDPKKQTIDSEQLIPGQPELDIQTLAKTLLDFIATKGSIDYYLFQLTLLETLGIWHSDINEPTNAPMLTSLCQSIPNTLDQTNTNLYADIKTRTKAIHTLIFTEIENQLKKQYESQKSKPEINNQNLQEASDLLEKSTKFTQLQNEAEVILRLANNERIEAQILAFKNLKNHIQLIALTVITFTHENQSALIHLLTSINSTNQNSNNLPIEVEILKALFALIETEKQKYITVFIQEVTDAHKKDPTNSMSFDTLSKLFQ